MLCKKLGYLSILVLSILYVHDSSQLSYKEVDSKYYLLSEAYNLSKSIFNTGTASYIDLKQKSLDTLDTFLDLVTILNEMMSRELRSAIVKFYKIKYFHDFTSYTIAMDEIINITEHCLAEPTEKLIDLRNQFHGIIKNFEDVRNFNMVNKCNDQLPDEVAVAHCILHQAVLFNETMQENLVTIVTVKTRQHAQDMNESIYGVQNCLTDFVPKFFEQLLVDVYTNNCDYLRVINASNNDLIKDNWRTNVTHFPQKWKPLTELLKTNLKTPYYVLNEPLFATIFASSINTSNTAATSASKRGGSCSRGRCL